MTKTILISLALPAAFIVAVFYFGGWLLRRRMLRPDTPPHWLLDDSRGLEDAFVEFFASSKTSAEILQVLAARRSAIGFKALARELHDGDESPAHHHQMPLTAVRAVLKILLSAGLARMRAGGFSITDLGREVSGRMRNRHGGHDARPHCEPSATDQLDHTELNDLPSSRPAAGEAK